MHNENNGMAKGVFIGLLTGAAVGSIIALLFASESGNELRKDISTKSKDLAGDIDQIIEKAKDKVSQLVNDGKGKFEKVDAETRVKIENHLKEAERLLNETKDKAGNLVQLGKERFEKESEQLKSAIKAGRDAYNTK